MRMTLRMWPGGVGRDQREPTSLATRPALCIDGASGVIGWLALDGGADYGAEVQSGPEPDLDGEEGHHRAHRAIAGFVGQDRRRPEEDDIAH